MADPSVDRGDAGSRVVVRDTGVDSSSTEPTQLSTPGWNRAALKPVGPDGKVVGSDSNSTQSTSKSDASKEEQSVLDALDRQAKEFDKDAEIDRIMKVFKLDGYAVLDLQPGVPTSTIRAVFRRKSLLIHPDKTSNPLAPEAFDRLAKSHADLVDEGRRAQLDSAIADARSILIRELGLTIDDEEVKNPDAEFITAWREKSRMVLVDDEMRRRRQRRAQMQEEGREKRKADADRETIRLKREHDVEWEKSREKRIESWRDFQKDKVRKAEAKRKKSKLKPIG